MTITIKFTAFDLAYALYFSRKHQGEEYSRDKNTIGNRYDLLFKIIGIWDNGRIAAAIDVISKIIRKAKIESLDDFITEDLSHFDEYTISEIETHLPAYFAYDIKQYVNSHVNTRILFTIDTFEALNVQQTEEIHRRRNEDWVKDLIGYFGMSEIPNCCFMIMGRDELKWEEDESCNIQNVKLEDFSPDWALRYLQEQGVGDFYLAEHIVKASKGHPFHLYLSARLYAELINKGKTPSSKDFGKTPKEIIKRFIYNLGDEEVNILKYLSVPRFFNYEIFSAILSEFSIAHDPERFEHICSYSFVSISKAGRRFIHALMRDELLFNTSDMSRRQVHGMMLRYFQKQYDVTRSTADYTEMIYHAVRSFDLHDFDEWFTRNDYLAYLKKLQERGEQTVTYLITEDIISRYQIRDLSLSLVNIYIDALHLGGDYVAAVKTCHDYINNYSLDEILQSENLCKMLLREKHHSMFYLPVDSLICDVEKVFDNKYVVKYNELYNELLFLIGGNLGVLSGRFDYAEKWLDKALKSAVESGGLNYILRSVRKIADIYTFKGHPEIAIEKIREYITEDSVIEKRYEIYILASLSEAYRKNKNITIAKKCTETILKKSKENNIPGWVAHAILSSAIVAYDENDYDTAISLCDEAIKKYRAINHRWGEITAGTLLLMSRTRIDGQTYNEEAQKLKQYATEMNYRYNIAILDEYLKTGHVEYLQLFYL